MRGWYGPHWIILRRGCPPDPTAIPGAQPGPRISRPFFWLMSIAPPFPFRISYTIFMTAAASREGDDDAY
jgi:hypothetical protein